MTTERVIEARGDKRSTIRGDEGEGRRATGAPASRGESPAAESGNGAASPVAEAGTRLAASGYVALRQIRCESRDGVLFLHGCVPSYHLKQLAQTLVRGIEGVAVIVNSVQVVRPHGQTP